VKGCGLGHRTTSARLPNTKHGSSRHIAWSRSNKTIIPELAGNKNNTKWMGAYHIDSRPIIIRFVFFYLPYWIWSEDCHGSGS